MLGDLVRDHRRRLGLSQEELAASTGVSVRAIRKIETGRTAAPRPATVRLLADAFGLQDADRERLLRAGRSAVPADPPTPADPTDPAAPPALPDPSPASGPDPARSLRPHEVPAQLPSAISVFTGRQAALEELDRLLPGRPGSGPARPPAVVISAVSGTAGVGKTSLAVHWAQRVRGAFPDGQLYVNLRGFDPAAAAVPPAEAVRGFLQALGVPPARIPSDEQAQTGLYRTLLTGRRLLIVLDNACDADQVRPLLPGTPHCLALITSRDRLTSLAAIEGAHLLALDLLTPAESFDLLVARLGRARASAEPEAVAEITARCAGLPLALAIVAARAATQPRLPLSVLADELRATGSRLDALDGGDPATQVRAVFSWSYRALSDAAAGMFRLLGLHPGPDIAVPAAAALAGVPVPRARTLLEELTRGHLLTATAHGRYTSHDLLRTFATELVTAHDGEDARLRAAHRMFDHYLHTARQADSLITLKQDAFDLPPAQPGTTPEALPDSESAMAWFTAEHQVLLGLIERIPPGLDSHTWHLASALTTFLDRQGHWPQLGAAYSTALAAAVRTHDPAGEAAAHQGLGVVHARLARPHLAATHLRVALHLFAELDSHPGQARTHQHLARLAGVQGDPRQALEHARHSLAHYQAIEDRGGQSAALNHLGWFLAQLGEHQAALGHCRQALALAQEVGDLNGQAHTWDSLGYIHHQLGDHSQAVLCYHASLDLFERTGDRHSQATGLRYLGDAHVRAGNVRAAHGVYRRALSITTELGLPDTDPLRADLLQLLHPLVNGIDNIMVDWV